MNGLFWGLPDNIHGLELSSLIVMKYWTLLVDIEKKLPLRTSPVYKPY